MYITVTFIGHVAESMQVTEPDVFVTSDGGYHWSLVSRSGRTFIFSSSI